MITFVIIGNCIKRKRVLREALEISVFLCFALKFMTDQAEKLGPAANLCQFLTTAYCWCLLILPAIDLK